MSVHETAGQLAVPFLDLAPTHEHLKDAVLREVGELFETGAFTNGPAVARFEEEFAAYCGVEHCVGVSSGLDALRLGLLATGLEPGDEIVVPAATFVATLEAVTQAGGVPVPADVSEDDYGLDPAAAAAAVGSRTRAPVARAPLWADGRPARSADAREGEGARARGGRLPGPRCRA